MWGYGPGSGYGMMGGYGYGIGPIGMIIWVLILVAVVAAIVWLVRSLGTAGHHLPPPPGPRRSSGLDILEERYAKGEINREEYLEKKKDIGG
jgi:putative membrane protein